MTLTPSAVPGDQYLPIGCVVLRNATDLTEHDRLLLSTTCIASGDPRPLDDDISTLCEASWIIAKPQGNTTDPLRVWRISILPNDVACCSIDRTNKKLQKCMTNMLMNLDVSSITWTYGQVPQTKSPFDLFATPDDVSLYYLFNTLPSPAPYPKSTRNRYNVATLQRMLDTDHQLRGLESELHPYQRRSAAMMIQREASPGLELDPRIEIRTTPTGKQYFFGPRDRTFYTHPRMYDNVRGGILAESMGLGKTIICLACILGTKGQLPAVPPQYAAPASSQDGPASLATITARAIRHHQIPWQAHFEQMADANGEEYLSCRKIIEQQPTDYEIPPPIVRSNRSTSYFGLSKRIRRCAGTIVVVPRNLVHQWRSEISKHIRAGALKVLVMDSPRLALPDIEELCTYDLVLFSRPRFELESKDDDFIGSPLIKLHWLRIIVDEGHGFSSMSSSTNAAVVAEKLVKAERRWIVSGTPAKDLLGTEVELPALTSMNDSNDYRKLALERRMSFDASQERSSGAITALGALVSRFLQVQPWTASINDGFERPAIWDEYVFRHEDVKLRTYSSFSTCLRRALTCLVVKTRPEDVERDLVLPRLTHRTIRLEPSTIDKMTANLFVLLFTANAITSERTDQDYLFHKNSTAHLHRLIANLRQSTFSWTGFDSHAVMKSIETACLYLQKEDVTCSMNDRQLMTETIAVAGLALHSPLWEALSESHEIGLMATEWPSEFCNAWAFEQCHDPMTTGLSLALSAQRYINNHLSQEFPTDGFFGAGVKARLLSMSESEADQAHNQRATQNMVIAGVPDAGLQSENMGLKRLSVSGAMRTSPKKAKSSNSDAALPTPRSKKRKLSFGDTNLQLSPDSELGRTCLAGTTSSKLTYLIDQVSKVYEDEKILVFYEGANIAYYLSQAFDLLKIKHLIYANTLSGEQRSKYIVLFDTDPNQRILLMDIKQAAHGLNLSSASRVFFVNPPCRPDIEAQAIKRAHRIGQTRPVHVETLVLRGTVEEAMHDHATKMTSREHLAAKTLEDDAGIRGIIQNARVLPLTKDDFVGSALMSHLQTPQQLFGRPGRGTKGNSTLENELFGGKISKTPSNDKPRKSKVLKTHDNVPDAADDSDCITIQNPTGATNVTQTSRSGSASVVNGTYASIFGGS